MKNLNLSSVFLIRIDTVDIVQILKVKQAWKLKARSHPIKRRCADQSAKPEVELNKARQDQALDLRNAKQGLALF